MYLNVKRSKLHKVESHPLVFPCDETIDWIIQSTYMDSWKVRDHIGTLLAAITSIDCYLLQASSERGNFQHPVALWLCDSY